jgi:uncharacterized protein
MDCIVWTTKNCNLNCKYCYEHNNKENGNMGSYIEDKTLNKIKDSILNSNEDIHLIQFHGGEPLLNFKLIKRFVQEIEKIKGNSIVSYGLTTNGTIWNDEINTFFTKYKESFSGNISISIDGNFKNHNKNRVNSNGSGSFDLAIDTASSMKAIFENLRCRVTVAPNTVEDLFINIKYLVDFGFKQIAIAFDSFSNKWDENHIDIIDREYKKVLDYWDKSNCQTEISIVDEIIQKRKNLGKCKPRKHYYIDGLIYPCIFVVGLKKYNIGNIENGVDKNKVEEIAKISSVDNKDCKNCSIKKSCISNRCKLINKVITGNFYTPPAINCVLEHIQIENKINFKLL